MINDPDAHCKTIRITVDNPWEISSARHGIIIVGADVIIGDASKIIRPIG